MLFLISGFAGNSSASRGADAAAMYLSAYPENCLAELLHPGKAFHIVAKYYAIIFTFCFYLLLRQLKMLISGGIGNFRMLEVIANLRRSFNERFHKGTGFRFQIFVIPDRFS
jgi:hypothetical protein